MVTVSGGEVKNAMTYSAVSPARLLVRHRKGLSGGRVGMPASL